MSKFCQVVGCPEESYGSFICLTHWAQVPEQLRNEINRANQERISAAKLAQSCQLNRSTQTMAAAKRTAYQQAKNRALQLIDARQQEQHA